MTSLPVLPIFVSEGRDVDVYASVWQAEADLETVDVEGEIYTGYDAAGRRLRIEARGEEVNISLAEDEPSAVAELSSLLRGYLEYKGDLSPQDPDCDLSCLVLLSRRYAIPERSSVLSRIRGLLGLVK